MKPKQKSNKTIKNNNSKTASKPKAIKIIGEVWDLEQILAGKSFDEWLKVINASIERFKKYRDILNNNITPQKVLEIVKLEEEIAVNAGRVEVYYSLKFHQDVKDSQALAKLGQLKQIIAQINNDMIFFSLWFMHLDDKVASKILQSKELAPYKYNLELTRKSKPYTKTEEIEKILEIKDITGGNAYAELYDIITNNYLYDWFGKKVALEEITSYFKNEDPKLRQKAYELILGKYKEDSTVLAEIYKDVVQDWCNDGIKIRGYKNSINIRNISQDISDEAVDTLLRVVRKNVGLFKDYFKLKYELNKKAGQKYPYSRYHLYAPLALKNKKTYDYGYSKTYVLDTYKKFDQRFYDRALRIFNDRHVHSHPTPGKRGGAFCMSVNRGLTPYLLLNHSNNLKDVFTMIHELGHGIHDIFAAEKQTDMERHAPLIICETASVFSEMILSERLLSETKDVEEKKYIITQLLDNQWATVIRQAYFVIFEVYAHQEILKGATKEKLDEQYNEFLKEQFGDMQIPELFKNEWNYISHIHEMPFYCYAYAWGNLFVLALYDMYRREGKPFIEKYIDLLSSGGSDSPANVMKKLGIDAESEEFWQRGFNIIKEEVEELRKLAK